MVSPGYHHIITKGLGCNAACDGLITSVFSLYCIEESQPGTGGGPYPGSAWNKVDDISNFFSPVESPYYVPVDQEHRYFGDKKKLVLKVNFGGRNIERVFLVPKRRANIIIRVMSIINTTIHQTIPVYVRRVRTIPALVTAKIRKIFHK